jgi:excisionase family DNA binding protein
MELGSGNTVARQLKRPHLRAVSKGPTVSSSRIGVAEVAERLAIGRMAVYALLKAQIIPAIRLGRRWIISRHAYEQWERTCGTRVTAGLSTRPEVMVLN